MATGFNVDVSTVDAELTEKIKDLEEIYNLTNKKLLESVNQIEVCKSNLRKAGRELQMAETEITVLKEAIDRDRCSGLSQVTTSRKDLATAESKLAKNEAEIEKLKNESASTDLMIEAISKGISGIAVGLKMDHETKSREIEMKNLAIQELEVDKLKAEALEYRTSREFEKVAEMLKYYEDRSSDEYAGSSEDEAEDEAVSSFFWYLFQQEDEIKRSINETERNIRKMGVRKSAIDSNIAALHEEFIRVNDRVKSLEEELTRKTTEVQDVRSLWGEAATSKTLFHAALNAKLNACVIKRQESNVGPAVNSVTRVLLEALFKTGDDDEYDDKSDKEEYCDVHQLLMYILEYGINIGRGSQ